MIHNEAYKEKIRNNIKRDSIPGFVLFKSNYESILRHKDVQNTIAITFIHFLPFSEKHESKIAQLTMHTWFRKSNQSLIRTQRLFLFKTTHRKHTKQ